MLKHATSLYVALGGLLLLPTALPQDDAPSGLAEQLRATGRALDYLVDLRGRVDAREPEAVDALLRATEPSNLAPAKRDERLVALRETVAELRLAVDRVLAGERVAGVTPPTGAMPTLPDGDSAFPVRPPSDGSPVPTVGLDATQREALRRTVGPLDGVDQEARRRGDEPVEIEHDGFSADRIRHGRLLVRAERYAEAVQILEHERDEPAGRYWLAQAYLRLDRTAEAETELRALADDEDAAEYARYARHDLDFLDWKREFERRRGGSK